MSDELEIVAGAAVDMSGVAALTPRVLDAFAGCDPGDAMIVLVGLLGAYLAADTFDIPPLEAARLMGKELKHATKAAMREKASFFAAVPKLH